MADSKPRTPKPRQLAIKLLEGALVKLQPAEQGQATGTAESSTEPAEPPNAGAGVQAAGSSPLARLKSRRRSKLPAEDSAAAEILSRRSIVENFRSRKELLQGQATPTATGSTEPAQPSRTATACTEPTSRTATACTEPVAAPTATLAPAAVPAAVPAAAQPAAAQPAAAQPAAAQPAAAPLPPLEMELELRGVKLKAMDMSLRGASSDPYFIIWGDVMKEGTLNRVKLAKSEVIKRNRNPQWETICWSHSQLEPY